MDNRRQRIDRTRAKQASLWPAQAPGDAQIECLRGTQISDGAVTRNGLMDFLESTYLPMTTEFMALLSTPGSEAAYECRDAVGGGGGAFMNAMRLNSQTPATREAAKAQHTSVSA